MLADEFGFVCICGQWVAVMHGECRALMSRAEYERWASRVAFVSSSRKVERDEYAEYA